jgi:ADP-heptose:LPS heptosyltransferase
VVAASPQPGEGEGVHAALLAARALGALGIAVPATVAELLPLLPRVTPSRDDEADAAAAWTALLAPGGDPVVALHPGSGGAEKRWPAEAFAALAEALAARGMRLLLIEGPQDAEVARAVLRHLPASDLAVPVVRGLSLGALAALLGRCAGYAGNDSGVSHLAALLGVPTAALFGATDPALWAPLGPRVTVVRAPSGSIRDLATADVDAALRALAHGPNGG